jgi:hypothetical protein
MPRGEGKAAIAAGTLRSVGAGARRGVAMAAVAAVGLVRRSSTAGSCSYVGADGVTVTQG